MAAQLERAGPTAPGHEADARAADASGGADTGRLVRSGLLALAGLTTLGIGLELAAERHWTQPAQLIAWAALALLAAAVALAAREPAPRRVRVARALAVLVMLTAVIGVWQHIAANYDAAPLDFRYGSVWDALSEPERWWLAISKTVGPAPPLAPAALAEAALCVLLGTLGVSRRK